MRKNQNIFAIRAISFVVIAYLFISLVSPIFLEDGRRLRNIGTPDIILISVLLLFNSEILSRLENFGLSKEKGITAKFKIGKDQVPIEDLGEAITDRLRELEKNIESITTKTIQPEIKQLESKFTGQESIPKALDEIIEKSVYKMLESNLWLGRYVSTLAKNTSVTEETMLEFCRSRDDIALFKDGERWVAALKKRLDK